MACDAAEPGWREESAGDAAFKELQRRARGYAQARAEGVASERARWLAEVDRAASWFTEQSALNFKRGKDKDIESTSRENARGYAFKCSAKRMHKMKSKMAKD